MVKFIKSLIVFFLFAVIVGEIVIRVSHSVSDIPQRHIDEFGIQKYYPNQSGYWKDGNHKWIINKLGWAGELPKSYNNLITIIGDSFIENFMNPNECHQSVLLKEKLKDDNFLEAGRSGVSFIEAFEISKQLDSLNPKYQLIYANNNDFYESIRNIKKLTDITQVDLNKNKIIYGEMKAPFFKKILYNFKLMYYFYNRFPLGSLMKDKKEPKSGKESSSETDLKNEKEISKLLNFIKLNYSINNKIIVFHPNADKKIIRACENIGLRVIILNSKHDKSWTFEHDSHWTCYGHEKVAGQVAKSLVQYGLNN